MRFHLPKINSSPVDLYIGPLPNHMTYSRFKHYFQGFLQYMQVEIRRMAYEDSLITYAVVTAVPPRIERKLIAKFDGRVLGGMPVVVRPFVHRAAGNERRSVNWRNHPWKFFNRRCGNERRRYRLITELEYRKFNEPLEKMVRQMKAQ